MASTSADPSPDGRAPPAGQLELLAPAGDFPALQAALLAGASAVYFGLTTLNARRCARNFRQDEFLRAVQAVHAAGARAYLTLNIDLTQRELGQAARILELARQCRADAVLVRDPALLALKAQYADLEFHFSTQTCMANSADVAAAARLGVSRVVLARELTLGEITAASAVPGIRTEVFVQGALCFCVSGRCLLSSWVGGRSGNRGACTSPCRVPWAVADRPGGTPLSMRDLCAIHRLDELRRTGVWALKIEGRLKSAAWVGKAVGLFRRALSGEEPEVLLHQAAELGAYAGRSLTCAYLDGERSDLTALAAGRPWAPGLESLPQAEATGSSTYDLHITVGEKTVSCRCEHNAQSVEWSIPRTFVRRRHKAIPIAQLLARLGDRPIQGCLPANTTSNDPQFLLVPRAANAVTARISSVLGQLRRPPDEQIRIDLPPAVREIVVKTLPSPANHRRLGDKPDRLRLHADAAASFFQRLRSSGVTNASPAVAIIEGLTSAALPSIVAGCAPVVLIVALPSVFFEDDIPALRDLLSECNRARLTVEVNSWGGWLLAAQAAVTMESGPGLAVLNSVAAGVLGDAGIQCLTLSPEADRAQLEDLTAHCPVPCSLTVFARPPLLITRAQLPDECLNKPLTDRRGVSLIGRRERGLWVFRPPDPFDLRGTINDRIRVHHLVVDLIASPDPLAEWLNSPQRRAKPFRFNYDRSLF